MLPFRTKLRRSCYAALPASACLIVAGFWLMPNHGYRRDLFDGDASFVFGFYAALIGVVLAASAFVILVLVAEE